METLYMMFKDLPDLAQLLVAVVVTLISAKIVESVILVTLRAIAQKTRTETDDLIIGALSRPLFYSVVSIGVAATLIVASFPDSFERVVWNALYTVLLFLWTVFLFRVSRIIIRSMASDERTTPMIKRSTAPLFENASMLIIGALSVYFAFLIWGINMTAWLASAGIMGIAIGFAAKDTLANLFAGLFILIDAPYKIGDYIVLDTGERGKVSSLGLRSTRILTRGDVEVTVPNSVMSSTKITNESGGPLKQYRVLVSITVAYDSDVDAVENILIDAALSEERIVKDPVPRVRLRRLGDFGLHFDLLAWIQKPSERGLTTHHLNKAVLKACQDNGIKIPYPRQDVHLFKD